MSAAPFDAHQVPSLTLEQLEAIIESPVLAATEFANNCLRAYSPPAELRALDVEFREILREHLVEDGSAVPPRHPRALEEKALAAIASAKIRCEPQLKACQMQAERDYVQYLMRVLQFLEHMTGLVRQDFNAVYGQMGGDAAQTLPPDAVPEVMVPTTKRGKRAAGADGEAPAPKRRKTTAAQPPVATLQPPVLQPLLPERHFPVPLSYIPPAVSNPGAEFASPQRPSIQHWAATPHQMSAPAPPPAPPPALVLPPVPQTVPAAPSVPVPRTSYPPASPKYPNRFTTGLPPPAAAPSLSSTLPAGVPMGIPLGEAIMLGVVSPPEPSFKPQ